MVERIYYQDPHVHQFTANVTGCEKSEKSEGWWITLNRTAFYPEGGGQPFDIGFIGQSGVKAVYERNGDIIHCTGKPIEIGTEVFCKIDWRRRFQLMQEHTGEHILSGIIKRLFGFENVGFHIGSEFVTVDINGLLTDEQLLTAEIAANNAIYENISIEAGFKSSSELELLEYRSKGRLSGDIRIVQIGDYDICACCGIHCKNTGEVGLLKVVNYQKYKSGQRIFLLCGIRAMEDYAYKNKSAYEISAMLSAKPSEIVSTVRQLRDENDNLRRSLAFYKNRVFMEIAEKTPDGSQIVCIFEDGLSSDELRRLCLLICERSTVAAVFSGDGSSYKYAIGSKMLDARVLASTINSKLSGRGGGKKGLTQGSVVGNEKQIRDIVYNELSLSQEITCLR